MSAYIAKKTVRLLVDEDKKIKNSEILIMGFTFKENCPDIRNTKVIDIVEELEEFGCQVDIYDPWVNKNDMEKSFKRQLIESPFSSLKRYEAIIVCVAHNQFKELSTKDFNLISEGRPVVLDVKGIVKEPTWRL